MRWLERVFRRRHLYDELGEELREHIEEKTEQLMRLENLSRNEARQAALRAFGNLALLEERSREVWHWPRLESVLADLKLAFRRLSKVAGLCRHGAPYAGHRHRRQHRGLQRDQQRTSQAAAVSRFRTIWWRCGCDAPGAAGLANFSSGLQLSPSMYLTFAEHNRTFQSIGLWIPSTANVTGIEQPEGCRRPDQRRRSGDARGSADAGPLDSRLQIRIHAARRRDAELWLLAAAVWRRPRRHRPRRSRWMPRRGLSSA